MTEENKRPFHTLPVDYLIAELRLAYGGFAIDKLRLQGNQLLAEIGVRDTFTVVICDWDCPAANEYIRNAALIYAIGQRSAANPLYLYYKADIQPHIIFLAQQLNSQPPSSGG